MSESDHYRRYLDGLNALAADKEEVLAAARERLRSRSVEGAQLEPAPPAVSDKVVAKLTDDLTWHVRMLNAFDAELERAGALSDGYPAVAQSDVEALTGPLKTSVEIAAAIRNLRDQLAQVKYADRRVP